MGAENSDSSKASLLLDGRYRLIQKIGSGGRGVVYEARHEEMGRNVAVKFLTGDSLADSTLLDRFRREGRAAGRLHHPNVVVVHDFCVSKDQDPYLVMELCDGGSLADELGREGKLSLDRALAVLQAVGSAVHAAHEAGIIHRDLKPGNILISKGTVKVADFGLASLREDDPAPGLTGEYAVGSPHYMSPEQAQGLPAVVESDVYGLAVIAYEMLTGFVPFSGSSVMSILMKHLTETPRSPSALDPAVPIAASEAILKALKKEPHERFPAMLDFVDAITAAIAGPVKGTDVRASTRPIRAITTMEIAETPEEARGVSPIGRDAQLQMMNQRLLEALRGRGGFLLIAGEPGAGKTTLVEAFVSRELVARPEILTATGHCSEHFGAGEAYLPFLEVASKLTHYLDKGRISGFLRTLAPTWNRHLPGLFPEETLPDKPFEGSPLPAQGRMPREFTDFLAVVCTIRPLIVVLEDLHWADGATVDLLAYLARRILEMRLLVVATYRPSEIEVARHPLRQALRGLSSTTTGSAAIAPSPFSPVEVGAFLERELGVPVDSAIVSFVHKRTEGNPLFVVNVLRHLNALGAIRVEGGKARPTRPLDELADEVPKGITDVILSHFERLEETDRKLLQVASVQGESFDTGAVSAALPLDELDVEDRLDRLHRVHGLVDPAGEIELPNGELTSGYRFVHAFYQDALYGSIQPKRRGAWHQAIGTLVARRYASNLDTVAATLAVHFEKARDFHRAIEAAERAADVCAQRNPREASLLFEKAVALTDKLTLDGQPGHRARLLTRLARHLTDTAELAGDVRLYDRAEAAAAEALAIDPRGTFAAEARTARGLIRLERGENERALADLESVVGEHPEHAEAHAGLAYLFKNAGLWTRSLRAQARAGELRPGLAHSIPRLSVLIYQGQWDDALAESEALLARRPSYSHYVYWRGIVHFYKGDSSDARQWIERGYELDPDNFIAKAVFAFVLAHQGERDRARTLLAAAEPGAAADGTFTYWIAKVRAALGDLDEAVTWIGKAEHLGYWNAPWILADRALDPVRRHPGFDARIGSIEEKHLAFRNVVEQRSGEWRTGTPPRPEA